MKTRSIVVTAAMALIMAGCASQQSSTDNGSSQQAQTKPAEPTTTTYKGTFPCRSCTGIETTLSLKGDADSASNSDQQRTFTLDADYQGRTGGDSDEHYQGSWDVLKGTPLDQNARVIELTPQQSENARTYYFQQIDANTLELVNPQLYRFQNGSALQLKRQ